MKEKTPAPARETVVQQERTHFHYMLAKNPNYFGNIPGSKIKPNFKLIAETTYEQLTCVGYNPDTANMEATFAIKRSTGYSGNLCTAGSFEYVRFYLDFHDGAGFIDQGSVAMNVHDIPDRNDCKGASIFPIMYVATLKKKTAKFFYCDKPLLPTLKAILSWSIEPPAASPDWLPVWGSVMECDVQLKPSRRFIFPDININFHDYLTLAVSSPHLTTKQLAQISGVNLAELNPQPLPPKLFDIIRKSEAVKVPASRYAFKAVHNMVKYPSSEITLSDKTVLENAKIDVSVLIDGLALPILADASKANVDYEELKCVGLDYNTESLVATVAIKKKNGYTGDLCDAGSKEYISFWIDWDDKCSWQYINTVQLNVHDIEMVGDSLCYAVSLPLDATFRRKLCATPNVVRVRGVLSWNVAPSVSNADQLEYYGNRVDAHVQVKPGVILDGPTPLFTIIGGVDVDHINDASGLTKPGSVFAYNALPVPTGAPFGGEIVINGPSFPGLKYRFKITNLGTGTSYYLSNDLATVGWSPVPPYSPWYSQTPDAGNYYNFLPSTMNLLNVLARFNPGTEDKLQVEIEVLGLAGSFSKTIQMDNTAPTIQLQIDNDGDCTKYKKGDTIKGRYYVNDLHIDRWSFGSTWGGAASGTSNTPGLVEFSIITPPDAHPCGAVSLDAWDKTIVNSQSVGHESYTAYTICLRNS
jgi:hypothetical protein